MLNVLRLAEKYEISGGKAVHDSARTRHAVAVAFRLTVFDQYEDADLSEVGVQKKSTRGSL